MSASHTFGGRRLGVDDGASRPRRRALGAHGALVITALAVFGCASSARAQARPQPRQARPRSTAPPIPGPERVRVMFNGGALLAPGSFGQAFTLTKNVESTPVSTDLALATGFTIDGGARARVTRSLSIGASGFLVSSTAHGTLDATVPHPFYFGQPRPVSGDLSRLAHLERGVHVELAYPVSIAKGREFTVFGGPSIINAKQDLVADFRYSDSYPYDTASFTSADTTQVSKTVVGVHAGADITWRLSRSVRGGALVRYTFANLSLSPAAGNTVDMHAGGFQIAGSLRILVQKRPPRPARPAAPARPRR